MSKRILSLLFLFILHLCSYSQTPSPLILEIGLLDSDYYRGTFPPSQLIIGLELTQNAYYKLIQNGSTLKGGLFLKGFNSFSLESDNFFEGSGVHTYTLELKVEDRLIKQELEIAVEMEDKVPPAKKEPPVEKKEHTVMMYIGDQLVASSKKLPTAEPSKKSKCPLLPIRSIRMPLPQSRIIL